MTSYREQLSNAYLALIEIDISTVVRMDMRTQSMLCFLCNELARLSSSSQEHVQTVHETVVYNKRFLNKIQGLR